MLLKLVLFSVWSSHDFNVKSEETKNVLDAKQIQDLQPRPPPNHPRPASKRCSLLRKITPNRPSLKAYKLGTSAGFPTGPTKP